MKLWKSLKGAMIAGAGVGATMFLQAVGGMDWGAYGAIVGAVVSVLINTIHQFTKQNI